MRYLLCLVLIAAVLLSTPVELVAQGVEYTPNYNLPLMERRYKAWDVKLREAMIILDEGLTDLRDRLILVEGSVGDIPGMQADIAALQSGVATNANDIATLQSNFSSLGAQVTTNTDDIATLQSDVAQLDSDLTDAEAGISQAQSDILQLQLGLSQVEQDIASNEGNIATNANNISLNDADIAALDARVTDIEEGGGGGSSFIEDTVNSVPEGSEELIKEILVPGTTGTAVFEVILNTFLADGTEASVGKWIILARKQTGNPYVVTYPQRLYLFNFGSAFSNLDLRISISGTNTIQFKSFMNVSGGLPYNIKFSIRQL